MNKKFLFKCVVALSAITPAAIVSVVEEPVVVQAQTQEQTEAQVLSENQDQEQVQTGNFTTIDNVRVGQTRYSGYANGGSSVEIYNEKTDEKVEVPLLNGRFSYDLPAPNSAQNEFHHYTLKDSSGNVLDTYRHLPQGGHGVGNIDLTKATFKLEDEVTPNSVSGTVESNRTYSNQSVHAWNVDKQTNSIVEKSSAQLPSSQSPAKFTVEFKQPLTQNSKLQLFVEGSYNATRGEAADAFGNPHTYRTNVSTIENLNIVGDPVYPEPVTPEVTPEPATPEVTPEPATPEVTPEPVTPEVTPEPVTPEVTPEPVTPEVTPETVTSEVTVKPVVPEVTDQPVTTEATSAPAATETAAEPVIDEAQAKEDAKAEAEATSKAGADQAPVVDEAKAKEDAKAKAEGQTAAKDTKATDTKSDKSKAADPKADAKKADDNKAAGLPKTGANTILAGLGVTTALAGVATLTFNRKRK